MSRDLVFYTTAGCHLCEEAEQIVTEVLAGQSDWRLQRQDIAESETLTAQYGIRIPVVRRADTEQEIGWPFDHERFRQFLAAGAD